MHDVRSVKELPRIWKGQLSVTHSCIRPCASRLDVLPEVGGWKQPLHRGHLQALSFTSSARPGTMPSPCSIKDTAVPRTRSSRTYADARTVQSSRSTRTSLTSASIRHASIRESSCSGSRARHGITHWPLARIFSDCCPGILLMDSSGSWKTPEFTSGSEHDPQECRRPAESDFPIEGNGTGQRRRRCPADSERQDSQDAVREWIVAHVAYNCEVQSSESV